MMYRHRTLKTNHGSVTTPTLFPVRNIGKRSSDNTPEYAGTVPDFPTAMVNARAIGQRETQWERLQDGVSIREDLGVPQTTVLFADSGGFDFQSTAVDTTPQEILTIQQKLDADIYGTLDLPLSSDKSHETNQDRIDRSIEYALTASEAHDGTAQLFASVHGYDPETIRNSIHYLERHGEFDGYAIGSLVPIRTRYEQVTNLILAARRATDKHLHIYGLGGLVYVPLLLYLGVDSFDSSAFIRSAGLRYYFIPGFGGERMTDIETLDYLPCCCPICGPRPFEEVREQRSLLVKHNLWALVAELRRFRYLVEVEEDIEAYLDLRFRGNPAIHRAFETARQQIRRLT